MCGIFSVICNSSENTVTNKSILLNEYKTFEQQIRNRGPNFNSNGYYNVGECSILMASSVLWLQGAELTKQPIEINDFVLVYNGDVFGGLSEDYLREIQGDTCLFFDVLRTRNFQLLERIQGPFAFICLDISQGKIYFGRDKFGRRSLLLGAYEKEIVITSAARRDTKYNFIELPPLGVFSMDLGEMTWDLVPFSQKNPNLTCKLQELRATLNVNFAFESQNISNDFIAPNSEELMFLDQVFKESHNVFTFLNSKWDSTLNQLEKLLETSIRKRIVTQPKFCQSCYQNPGCSHTITGVLFSGGLDCAVLALLASKLSTRPIDLINVAFEKDNNFNTPDRLTGRETFQELKVLCPDRSFNFVEVNVLREELEELRQEQIADLIFPLNSILDDSLGCALWFASRAKTEEYSSPCRVLLVGMGADELFGGYSRHRAAFQRNGWEGLHNVLNEDWWNLPHRNLGRDDRVVSDHGRQLRTPYLDEDVVEFVRDLSSWNK